MRNPTERTREYDMLERDLEYRRESQLARQNADAASSFALGIALISLVGVVIAMFLFNQRTQAPAPVQAPPDVNITIPRPVQPEVPPVSQPPEVNPSLTNPAPSNPAPSNPPEVNPSGAAPQAPVVPDAVPVQP